MEQLALSPRDLAGFSTLFRVIIIVTVATNLKSGKIGLAKLNSKFGQTQWCRVLDFLAVIRGWAVAREFFLGHRP